MIEHKSDQKKEREVRTIVFIILSLIGILFFILCLRFGYSAGHALGEFIYNITH